MRVYVLPADAFGCGQHALIDNADQDLVAAAAYNVAALQTWGEFARLNQLEGSMSLGDAQ